ncbi:MAG: flagellar hook-associated protein 2 [Polyangiales bacterium]|jgi:flagellar hook-associated protein 2
MNSITSFSGLATGIDTGSIVTALVQAESLPIARLRTKQANHDSMSSRFETIRDRMDVLKTAMEAITDESAPATVSSSAESIVGATSQGDAVPGSYVVEVSQLAAAERTHSDGVASKDTAGLWADGSSIGISVGGDAEVSISVSSTDTLDSIARRINDSDLRASASVIFDGSEYRLQVSGTDTGLANSVSFTETGLDLGLTDPANETVSSADALFTIDGLSMSRESNDVSEAITGVQLSLDSVTTSAVTINVGSDSDALGEKMQTFVDAYNSVVNGIAVESVFTGEGRTGDSLAGDSTLRGLQRSLSSALFGAMPGFETIRQLGLETNQSGKLELDLEAFGSALNENGDALLEAFAGDGVTEGLFERLTSLTEQYADKDTGLISTRIDSFESENRRIDQRIESMELRVDKFEENLLRKFATLETLVAGLKSQGEQMLAVLGSI